MSVSLRQHFWKTKMCPLFLENKCKEGDKCDYAHSVNDLRTIPDLRRTKLCFKLLKGETCMNSNCNFAHSQNELKSAQNLFAYKSSMCKFIGTNNCLNGSTCRFAHSVEELRISKADEFANEKSGIDMEKTIINKNNNNNDDDDENNNNIDVTIIKNKKNYFLCNKNKNNNCNDNSIFSRSQNKNYLSNSSNINGINTKNMNNEKMLNSINTNNIKNRLNNNVNRKNNDNNNNKFDNNDNKINNNNNNRNRMNHNKNRTHNNNRMHNNKQKRKSNSHLSHHNDNRNSFVSNSESNMVFANYEITRNRKIFSNETNYNSIEMDERKGIEVNTEKTFENIQMDLYCERSNSSCSGDSIRKEKYMNELKEDTCKQNESIETTPKEMSPKKDICNDEHVVYENKYNASTESKNIQMHSSTEAVAAAAVPSYTPYYIPAVPIQEPMIPQYNYNYMNNFVVNRMMNPEFKMQNNPMQYMTPYIMPHPMNYYPANMNHPVPYFPYAPIDASFYQPMIPVEQKNVHVYESKETQQEEIVESPKKINKAKKYIDLKHPVSHIRTLQKEDIDDEESLLSHGENDIDNMTCILEVYKNHIIKATDNRNGNSLENTSDIRCSSSVRNQFGQMPNKSIQLDSMDDENMNDIEEKLRRLDINYKNRQEQNDASNVIFKEQSRIITEEMHRKNVETDEEEDETKKQNNRCSVYSYLHHGNIHQEKGKMNNDSSEYGKNYYPFVPQMNLNNQNAFYSAYYNYYNNMNNELYKF